RGGGSAAKIGENSTALLHCPQAADTEIAETRSTSVIVARRRPAAAGGGAPATAPSHAERARCRPCRIHNSSTRSSSPRVFLAIIPVLHPLPDVAMHVV